MSALKTPAKSSGRVVVAYSILVIGLTLSARLIFGGALFPQSSPVSVERTDQSTMLASLESTRSTHPAASTRRIESIRVGERVLAENPEIAPEERARWQEPDWQDWLHLTLQMPLPTDQEGADPPILDIEILRPEQWVLDQLGVIVAQRDDVAVVGENESFEFADSETALVPYSPLRPTYRYVAEMYAIAEVANAEVLGLTVDIDLPEMGAVGTAMVSAIQPCPPVKSSAGQVVTATFAHPPTRQVLDVVFEGESDAIGVTDNHLFWSEDRQAFVAIGQMESGERVVTFHGDTKRIESRLPRPGPQLVYNLEVYGEHVYFVGQQGLLVHNAYSRGANGDDAPSSRYTRDAFEGRHIYRAADDFDLGIPAKVDPKYVHKSIRQKIQDGWTNADLMRSGNSPIGHDGRPINLHHVLGAEPGPMVEILGATHKRHHRALHGLIEDGNSFRNVPGLESKYNSFRRRYWKWRLGQLTGGSDG